MKRNKGLNCKREAVTKKPDVLQTEGAVSWKQTAYKAQALKRNAFILVRTEERIPLKLIAWSV